MSAYESHTLARFAGHVHVSVLDRAVPTVRLGNLVLRFHDAPSTTSLALLLHTMRDNVGHLVAPARVDRTATATRALTFVEVHGAQRVHGLRRISPAASRSHHGETSLVFGDSVRLVLTDLHAAERVLGALERVLHDATITFPLARSLEETAIEIRRRWWMRHPQHYPMP